MYSSDIHARISDSACDYLYFNIDEVLYSIEADRVLHIAKMSKIHKFPKMPRGMKGFLNLRGSMIPIYSLHVRFGKQKPEYTEKTRIIVIWMDGAPLGLIADSIEEAVQQHTRAASEPKACRYVSGITQIQEEQTVLLLTRIG